MTELIAWIDPQGVEHPLNIERTLGRFMPPIALLEDAIPTGAGTRIRNIRASSRALALDLYLTGTDEERLIERRALITAFDTTTRGPGTIRHTAHDGTVRTTVAYYESGFEGDDSALWDTAERLPLTLRCPDPYWYAIDTMSVSWPIGTETTTFFPIFPLVLGASSVQGSVTLGPTNGLDTEVPIWPTWVIAGPGTNVQLTNLNTGESIVWSGSLAAGDQLVIDTSESRKTVLLNGANAFADVTSYGFWQLRPGVNEITVSMDSTDDNSRIAAYWRNAYLTP